MWIIIIIIIIMIISKLKLFHFDHYAFTVTLLPWKFIRVIFWFPRYTLGSHWELIFIIGRKSWITIKESLNNFDFVLVNNGYVNYCDFIKKGISRCWKVRTVKEEMSSIFVCCTEATKPVSRIKKILHKFVETKVTESKS